MTKSIRRMLVLYLVVVACASAALQTARAQSDQPLALVMTADGPVMPPMLDYIKRGIDSAEKREAEVLIIQLNTPGGDLMTTLNIIKAIRASTVPVVVYVAPKNAIAGSAGALITVSAHASAMAPETAIGALVEHITGGHLEGSKFQPMNINYGLLPPLEAPKVDADGKRIHPKERGRAKKRLMSVRALDALKAWRDAR